MASLGKKLGRGLAAGLTTVGQIADKREADEKEERRFAEQSERAERQLAMQEAESAARLEKSKLEVSMKRAQFNNQKLAQAGTQSNFDPRVMAKAFSDYGTNQGTTWNYNEQASAKAGEGVIIYDVGTKTKNSDGTLKPGPDGKAEVKALPGSFSQMRFENQDDHVNFLLRSADPAWALANDQADMTGAKTRAQAQKVHDERMKSDPAYALKYGTEEELAGLTIEGKKADIAKTKAETKNLDKGVAGQKPTANQAPVSNFQSASGKIVSQTQADVNKAKALATTMNKLQDFEKSPIDADDAARILQFKKEKKSQGVVKRYAKDVAAGTMTEEEFLSAFEGTQLPEIFVQRMFNKIKVIAPEEISKPGIFSRTWNKIFN